MCEARYVFILCDAILLLATVVTVFFYFILLVIKRLM